MAFSPSVNQTFSVQVTGSNQVASSRILSCSDGKVLWISVPTRDDADVTLEPGTAVALEFPSADAILCYTATVVERREDPPSLRLSWPEGEKRIQRREAVRVPVEFLVWVAVVRPNGTTAPSIKARCVDLSAGGLRLVTPELIPYPCDVELTLNLPGGGKHVVDGVVVRSGELQNPPPGHPYWSGVQFIKVSAPLRRDIAKMVMDVQRELLRRS
jgi:c-di-GMP-binding flagellar brake protein YcgR